MHFVYICKDGPNEELRYSIRSVLKNAQNASVSVVGGKPDWYKGHYIHVPQDLTKYKNANNNLLAAINSSDIPDDFIIMNDDFYILKPIESVDYFYSGTLEQKVDLYSSLAPTASYISRLRITNKRLRNAGIKNPLNYEMHLPFPVNKNRLAIIMSNRNPNILWRSVYGNTYKVGGTECEDVKIYSSISMKSLSYNYNNDSVFLSTDDDSFGSVEPYLKKNFRKRSFVEKNRL